MRKKQEEKKMTLSRWLIQKLDTDSFRAGKASGWIHPKADQKMIDAVGGMRNLLEQARELEKMNGFRGLFCVDWADMGRNINKIDVSIDIMDPLCKREGIENPRDLQLGHLEQMERLKKEAAAEWIVPFYDHILERLQSGELVRDVNRNRIKELDDKDYFLCINAVVNNQAAVWKRIFSAAIFAQNKRSTALDALENAVPPSKKFEKKYQSKVVTVLKDYSPLYEEGMTEEELLTAHGILSYAQTLEWKGSLQYRIDAGEFVDTSCLPYGTILNSQTLDHAVPVALTGVKRVVTIENKANYESMRYDPDTLYIYCHGFFSPKERRFLKHLAEIAEDGTDFLHWGDMDYGGIRIFLFNQKKLFPGLRPWRMDRAAYKAAVGMGAGCKLEPGKREELKHMDAGALEELRKCILENNLEIEQELLLAAEYKKAQL